MINAAAAVENWWCKEVYSGVRSSSVRILQMVSLVYRLSQAARSASTALSVLALSYCSYTSSVNWDAHLRASGVGVVQTGQSSVHPFDMNRSRC